MKDNKRLTTIFLIVFVDLLGFSLILPLIPFYAAKYGASPFVAGLLVASYALAQLIGAPLLGRLSDKYGRRPVLLISIAGTLAGFILLGLAVPLAEKIAAVFANNDGTLVWLNITVLALLFTSRILDGLTGGNISVAQAYISDVTDAQSRAKAFGLIGAAFGLGFIIGPVIGGTLSRWGFAAPAYAAATLATLNLLAVYLWLPESLTVEARALIAQRPQVKMNLEALRAAFARPFVGPLLTTRFLFGLAFSTFQTIFPLYAQYRLGLDGQRTAYILAYVGVLSVTVQGFGIRWLTGRFSDVRLIFAATVTMAVALLAWAFTPNVPVLLVVLIPLAAAGGTLNTVVNSTLSKSVRPEEIGGTLGLAAALESSTRVIGPSAGGALLQGLGTWAPGVAGMLITSGLAVFVWQKLVCGTPPELPQTGTQPLETAVHP